MEVSEEAAVPSGEGEPGHRRGAADVDADHAGVEVAFELPCRAAVVGEDRCAVAVLAVPADLDRIFKGLDPHDTEVWPENFFAVDAHGRLNAIDHGRAD